MTNHAVTTPYDWDRYEDDFIPNAAYVAQEARLAEIFSSIQPDPKAVLEIGPGLGRITKIMTDLWPDAGFGLFDISEAAIEKVSKSIPAKTFAYEVGKIEDADDLRSFFPETLLDQPAFDVVVAIEVFMHVPPVDAPHAVINALSAVRDGGTLISCDWTAPVNSPVRVQNYLHGYMTLFHRAGAKVIERQPTGRQSIFLVQP